MYLGSDGKVPFLPYSFTPGGNTHPPTQDPPQDHIDMMEERIRIANIAAEEEATRTAEQELMNKWNTDDLNIAQHLEWWMMTPVKFARDAYATLISLPDATQQENYISYIQNVIRANTAPDFYAPLFDQMDLPTLRNFGWAFLPEFSDYYMSRDITSNVNGFINAASDELAVIQDPDQFKEYKDRILNMLEQHGPEGWAGKIPAEIKVKFLKAFYPEEIQAAAIASKQAADKAKIIGITVVTLIIGTLFFTATKKKTPQTMVIK